MDFLLTVSYLCFPVVLILCLRELMMPPDMNYHEMKNLRVAVVLLVVAVMSHSVGLIGVKYQFDGLVKKVDAYFR